MAGPQHQGSGLSPTLQFSTLGLAFHHSGSHSPPKAHLALTLPVPSCGSDITKQHVVHRAESKGSLRAADDTTMGYFPGQGYSPRSTSQLCHYSLWTLAMSSSLCRLRPLLSPVRWGRPGPSCGGSSLFSFGLEFASSQRYALTTVTETAPFPSHQPSPLRLSILSFLARITL